MITNYHACYYGHDLSVGKQGAERLNRTLFDACVELNPHQIEAALFALDSPFLKGILLADEVGLGKTIEAGLVICQYRAERKKHILVICPASLRKQWEIELLEKFGLKSTVLDAKIYGEHIKQDIANPFNNNEHVVICSMHFASAKAENIAEVPWDLVVIDEAHKLRNVYRESNRIGRSIRQATAERKKLLLTATPLQNSLLELYGLSTLLDDKLFGDLASFKAQYITHSGDLDDLRDRMKHFCKRSLRSKVTDFVKYTERTPITLKFKPKDSEHNLYEAISEYLRRDDIYAFPKRQKHLLILLVRKVLASSPYAVAGTLEVICDRLERLRAESKESSDISSLWRGEDIDDDLLDEILEDEEELAIGLDGESESELEKESSPEKANEAVDLVALDAEIKELKDYIAWARRIDVGVSAKEEKLLEALRIGFEQMVKLGANKKVVIFTESRRTQSRLKEFLEASGYRGDVLTFNGSNTDEASVKVYETWSDANKDTGRVTGSRQIDVRAAIIDRFRDKESILIATEAGAEGLNLQFCSAVINFDLPWNPQRIEQRIGRCHRYGQKHDVVVINFLNERNVADCHVYELLDKKFSLFRGIFGASDDVLGTIESGVGFERRVLNIYRHCRTEQEIQQAFEDLQSLFSERIQTKMDDVREQLLMNFDEDVHRRIKIDWDGTHSQLDKISSMFWLLSRHMLSGRADFSEDGEHWFDLRESPLPDISPGRYSLISKGEDNVVSDYLYRLSHPLGQHVVSEALALSCPLGAVEFDISGHSTKISVVAALKGRSGWLSLQRLVVRRAVGTEEYLLFSGLEDSGEALEQETCEKLFSCMAVEKPVDSIPEDLGRRLQEDCARYVEATLARSIEDNDRYFEDARNQLDKWAEDQEVSAEARLTDTKRKIRDAQKRSRQSATMAEQLSLQQEIAKLEKQKKTLRRAIHTLDDEIEARRVKLVDDLRKRLKHKSEVRTLFTIRWSVV